MSTSVFVMGLCAVVVGAAAGSALSRAQEPPAPTPTTPAPPTAPAPPPVNATWDTARVVLDKHCFRCHTAAGDEAWAEARAHLDMDTVPFSGRHAADVAGAIREALGATGKPARMPLDTPGVVTPEETAAVLAWLETLPPTPEPPTPHVRVLDLPPARAASGTAWQPDATVVRSVAFDVGGWRFTIHGDLFLGFIAFGGTRGDTRVGALGWAGAMASHALGSGELTLRARLSPEPATVGEAGYPLVLQTGKSADDAPLHDRQHAHELFMELAASWAIALDDDLALELYLAASGEPALGPPAFSQRASAWADPLAPIGHHWQDATHIAFGVLTVGLFARAWKIEASWFNGREPGPERWDIDLDAPDSFALRATWNASTAWSTQLSYGWLASPGALRPGVSRQRVTASLAHATTWAGGGAWATALVLGLDVPDAESTTPAVLLESTLDLDRRHTVFGRAEVVRKSGRALALDEAAADDTFALGMLSLGYVLRLPVGAWGAPGVGVRGAMGFVPEALEPTYGSRVPLGVTLFLQLAFAPLAPHAMADAAR